MINQILAVTGGALTLLWGISHLIPTASVVKGFGHISADNKHIITMEWIIEGAALIFLGILTFLTTFVNFYSPVTAAVHWSVIVMLVVLTLISVFTGFLIKMVPFKLCPFIFTVSALFILVARIGIFR